MKKRLLSILIPLCLSVSLFAQDSLPKKEQKVFVKGYVKDLLTVFPSPFNNSIFFNNLIHNRFNFKYYPNNNITVGLEIRNQFYFGDLVSPSFAESIDRNNDVFDLSASVGGEDNWVFNSMIDRLYFEYVKKKFEIKIGRQRINWGINTIWNPNDIFNTYSYLDFDYEERPGSDAIRIQYYKSISSSFEFAFKTSKEIKNLVAALMWK